MMAEGIKPSQGLLAGCGEACNMARALMCSLIQGVVAAHPGVDRAHQIAPARWPLTKTSAASRTGASYWA